MLHKLGVVVDVGDDDLVELARRLHLFAGELPNGLQQLVTVTDRLQKRLLDQAPEEIEHVVLVERPRATNRLRRLKAEDPGEHRQAPEQHALVTLEQRMTPVNR